MKEKEINGYRALHIPDHPQAIKTPRMYGWVYEHRVVAEDMLGRPLHEDEEVHHLDEDKLNNHPENLLVLPCSQHLKLHAWLRRLGIDPKNYPTKICLNCSKVISHTLISFCGPDCASVGRRVVKRPSKEQLTLDVNVMSLVKTGVKYGVSDNSIRKWCKSYGIDIPTRYMRVTTNSGYSSNIPIQ